jgi:putative pyrroloquinoline-quinone-binding quinoprotein
MWRMLAKPGYDLRLIAALVILLGVASPVGSAGQPPAARTTAAIQGSVDVRDGGRARFRYYFNHNALKDCIKVGHSLIAPTESGNLIRFDADTLDVGGRAIIPGRGTAIATDSDRVLVGTQDGRIYRVDPDSLA